MNTAEVITALCGRITQLHGICSQQAAEIGALQKQLAESMARGAGRVWTAEDVVKSFSVYDPGKVQAIMEALNERGAPDSNVATAIQKALVVLDRSTAVEMLNTLEHAVFDTPAPPPAAGSLAARMLESTAPPAPAAAEPAEPEPPVEKTPDGFAIDEESGKPIQPLTVADLPRVPRKAQGGMADEKIETAL